MSLVVCAYPECGHRSDLQTARRCECARVRCSRCGRCWHEREAERMPKVHRPTTSPQRTAKYPTRVARKKKAVRQSVAARSRFSVGDARRLREVHVALTRAEVLPLSEQLAATRKRDELARIEAAKRKARQVFAARTEDEHQGALAGLRSKAKRLPLAASPSPPHDDAGAERNRDICIHRMERMNCALCNRGRYLPPIKTRR